MLLRSFTSPERRILQILIVVTIVSRLALAFRPEWKICSRPFIDDAFYIFNVSQHIAAGAGLTVDGIHQTNGIQPLITFIYAPLFAIARGDSLLGLRFCFILVALWDALSVLFIAKLIRRLFRQNPNNESPLWCHPPIIGAFLWTVSYSIQVHTTNGLETGLYSFLLICCCYNYATIRSFNTKPSYYQWIGFGTLLGITVLARIDSVIFVIVLALVELFRFKGKAIKHVTVFTAIALIISSPWWIFNFTVFGSVMPQSGQSEMERFLLDYNIFFGASTIANMFTVVFFLPKYSLPHWFHGVWFVFMSLFVFVVARRFHIWKYLQQNLNLASLLPLFIFGFVLVFYYIFFFAAPYFLERYFQPLRIFWIIMVASSIPILYKVYQLLPSRKALVTRIALFIFSIVATGFTIWGYGHNFIMDEPIDLYKAAIWAREHPQAKIGMTQSGIASFLSPNVINLDGKVNVEALSAIQHSDIGTYIVSSKLDYINDWIGLSGPLVLSASQHGAVFEPIDTLDAVIIYKRKR